MYVLYSWIKYILRFMIESIGKEELKGKGVAMAM